MSTSSDSNDIKINSRIMGDQSIAKSFKGILRVAHNMDLLNSGNDNFLITDETGKKKLNQKFYGTPSGLINISGGEIQSSEMGYPTPITGLSGLMTRYTQDNERIARNPLLANKLPLTDSMGNYLNWNMGSDAVTIGSDERINYFNYDNDVSTSITKVFPIFTNVDQSSTVGEGITTHVGYEKSKLTDTKKYHNTNTSVEIIGGDAALIHKHEYDNNEYHNVVYKSTKEKVEDFDTVMFSQCDVINDGDKKYLLADIVNLKEYVSKMISTFLKGNVVQVPTGSIINQFCSLEKWYALDDKKSEDDISQSCYIGHRPAMRYRSKSGVSGINNFQSSTVQGVCKKINRLKNPQKNTQLSFNTDDEMHETDSSYLEEIIPLYKRDYTLCDGSLFTIHVHPYNSNDQENRRASFERFFNLFFAIGYDYTDRRYISKRIIGSDFDQNTGKITIKTQDVVEKDEDTIVRDLNCLFAEDLVTILAFETIYKEYTKDKNSALTDIDAGTKWLSQQKFDDQFVFNSFIGHVEGMEIPFKDPNSNEDLLINIGKEVNKFSDEILYEYKENGKLVQVAKKIIELPSIQTLLKMFCCGISAQRIKTALKNYFNYSFQVPNLTQNTPSFIGSNGTSWCDKKYNKIRTVESWTSDYCQTNYPHRHFVFKSYVSQSNKNGLNISSNNNKPLIENFTGKSLSGNSYVSPFGYHGGGYRGGANNAIGGGEHYNYAFNGIVGNSIDAGNGLEKGQNGHGLKFDLEVIDNGQDQVDISFPVLQRDFYIPKNHTYNKAMTHKYYFKNKNDNKWVLKPIKDDPNTTQYYGNIKFEHFVYDPDDEESKNNFYESLYGFAKNEDDGKIIGFSGQIDTVYNKTNPAWTTGSYRLPDTFASVSNGTEIQKLTPFEAKGGKCPITGGYNVTQPKNDNITDETTAKKINTMRYNYYQMLYKQKWANSESNHKSMITNRYFTRRGFDVVKKMDEATYSWSHEKDPRFINHEPNRGRSSLAKNIGTDTKLSENYKANVNSFSKNSEAGEAQWFSPKNIKMLPLIKL